MNIIESFYYKIILIDKRNTALWKSMNNMYNIDFQNSYEPNFQLYLLKKNAIIYIPSENANAGGFTHELLHMKLHSLGVLTGPAIRVHIKKKKNLSKYLTKNLQDHLSNSLEHIKMLPIFLDMGFDIEHFISDYHKNKADSIYIDNIIQKLKIKDSYNADIFDSYVGRYFAIVACPNKNFHYGEALTKLKELSPDLYDVLNRFTEKWTDLNLLDSEIDLSLYKTTLWNFLDELEHWTENKNFITT